MTLHEHFILRINVLETEHELQNNQHLMFIHFHTNSIIHPMTM